MNIATARNGPHDRDGFALPVAIFALVVVGVLVTGGFYVARQETRIGTASKNSSLAFYLAESGMSDVIATVDAQTILDMNQWDETVVSDTSSDGIVDVTIMKMTDQSFFLDGISTVSRGGNLMGGASRRLGLIARIITPNIDPPGALTTVGNLDFGGNAVIDGNDTNPPEWPGECNPSPGNKPGVFMDDTTNVDFNGNEKNIRDNQLFGDPDFGENPSMTSDSLLVFGDLTFDDLAELASKVYTSAPGSIAPVEVGGACIITDPSNWGEPLSNTSPCFTYFPIIYLNNPGATWGFSDGRGQGILLVEGSLKVTGQFEFYGPVIIKGTLSTQGGGGTQHFHGGVMAANAQLADNTVLGTADIVYSSCALERAIMNNDDLTRMQPLAQRSWVDLSSVGN